MGHPLSVPDDFTLVSAKMVERATRPVHRETQAFACSIAVCRVLGAFIEGHSDIGAERDLDVHGMFGGEEMAAAVEVRSEVHAFVAHFA